ncbi:hypothetical protein Dsin_015041 [Dipteronia sinensis]|uniref:Something about silencing protein 10 n=1 Tax=Dipteronia sinensis TaxID=43782 RepID=A0AAE0AN27_9ROSI|nr:hypothetical protein Dsin_015041 [Dipteronia sinensis]
MGKRGSGQKKGSKNPSTSKRRPRDQHVNPQDMDDEIDAFHKMRDVVPLDINADVGDSDEDNDHPVFDFQDKDDDDDDDNDDIDDAQDTGMAAKIVRQQKFLQEKFGGVEDEMHDDDEDDDEKEKKALWGGMKNQYYYGDNRDFELKSSDDESLAEEEEEVLKMQKERAKTLEMEDFGLQDVSDSDRELTLEEISAKGKSTRKSPPRKETEDDIGTTYEEVKKDLNALSKEEQMDVVYSSAPELVGLLSELNDALEQLENKVNPLLSKVKEQEVKLEGGMRYLEVKQLLLLAYCQAITFYLLLKSEGQPVRDHPVIARLVEIKGLLDKMKELDGNLPYDVDEFLKKDHTAETGAKLIVGNEVVASAPVSKDQYETPHLSADAKQASLASDPNELDKGESLGNNENKGGKRRRQNDQVGVQSLEMLKIRAALEEKLKQKGVFSSIAPKPDIAKKRLKLVNGQLETHADFDDDAMDVERITLGPSNGHESSSRSSKLSQLATARPNKAKVISGDDDLPKRDDIGERRRKHELRVLAGAGIKSKDDDDDAGDELGTLIMMKMVTWRREIQVESEDEFYKQVKQQRAAKLAAKAEIYTRTSAIPSLPESVDGKRRDQLSD